MSNSNSCRSTKLLYRRMEGEQNGNLIWCVISSVAVSLYLFGHLLASFFSLKVGAKIAIVLELISIK